MIKDGKLYGRGGADDGYAVFAAVTAVKMMQEQVSLLAQSAMCVMPADAPLAACSGSRTRVWSS